MPQTKILSSKIQAIFHPEKDNKGEIIKVSIYILNGTDEDSELYFKVETKQNASESTTYNISKYNTAKIHEFSFFDLNNKLIFHFSSGEKNKDWNVKFKIKPDFLLQNIEYNQWLQKMGYVVDLYSPDNWLADIEECNTPKSSTSASRIQIVDDGHSLLDANQLKEMMLLNKTKNAFEINKQAYPHSDVIDLHIEKLHKNPSSLKKCDILPYQLRCFEFFLDTMVSKQYTEFKVIHGKGGGILKQNIERICEQDRRVKNTGTPILGLNDGGSMMVYLNL